MVKKIFSFLKQFPPTFVIGYEIYSRMPFLLPHDKSYFIFPHLMSEKKGLILDVGANNGISSAYFHKVNPQWKIIAFEPNSIHRRSLNRLKRNFKGFDYRPIGLSDRDQILTFYTPVYFGFPQHCETSSEIKLKSCCRSHCFSFLTKRMKFHEQKVEVKTIDELNLNPDVIKIDCEGDDFKILKGAKNTLERCRPFIVLENNEKDYLDLVQFVESFNFEVFFYDYQKRELFGSSEVFTRDQDRKRNLVIIPREKIEDIKKKIMEKK